MKRWYIALSALVAADGRGGLRACAAGALQPRVAHGAGPRAAGRVGAGNGGLRAGSPAGGARGDGRRGRGSGRGGRGLHLCRRRRQRLGAARARAAARLHRRSGKIPPLWRENAAWRAALRPAGHGQDAARACAGRRGGRAVLRAVPARISWKNTSASARCACGSCSSARARRGSA